MAYKESIERCTSGNKRLIVFTCIAERNEGSHYCRAGTGSERG